MSYRTYQARDYSKLRGLKGITDEQVEVHLKLYQGYVNRTNKLLETCASMASEGKFDLPYQETKRRLGWEWNGMRLHEGYFDALRPNAPALDDTSAFGSLAAQQFGSVEAWKGDLMGTAKSPGIGWTITYYDQASGQLLNTWINEHQDGHLDGCVPIVVLDVFEHAFSVYRKPTDRAAYLDDYYANVAWNVVDERLRKARG